MEKFWVIYALVDPRDGKVRYIGKTICLKKRLLNHVREAVAYKQHNHRIHWIRELISSSFLPVGVILKIGMGDGWQDSERKWIKTFRDAGANLVNGTDGGEGADGHFCSPETRAKISLIHRGKIISPEQRERLSALFRGRHISSEHREKLILANKGKHRSSATKAKISAATSVTSMGNKNALGMHHSDETKARISASLIGNKRALKNRLPEETRAKNVCIAQGVYCED